MAFNFGAETQPPQPHPLPPDPPKAETEGYVVGMENGYAGIRVRIKSLKIKPEIAREEPEPPPVTKQEPPAVTKEQPPVRSLTPPPAKQESAKVIELKLFDLPPVDVASKEDPESPIRPEEDIFKKNAAGFREDEMKSVEDTALPASADDDAIKVSVEIAAVPPVTIEVMTPVNADDQVPVTKTMDFDTPAIEDKTIPAVEDKVAPITKDKVPTPAEETEEKIPAIREETIPTVEDKVTPAKPAASPEEKPPVIEHKVQVPAAGDAIKIPVEIADAPAREVSAQPASKKTPPPDPDTLSINSSDIETGTRSPDKPAKSKRGRKSLKQATAEADLIEVPGDDILFSKQYYTMRAVAEMFRVNQSLLRFWETEFDILQPRKNKKGDRYFRPVDIKNLHLIYHLLRQRKYTIEGAKEFLKKNKRAEERFEAIQKLQEIRAFLLEWKAQL